jgi:ankyrin repeat protein
MNQNPKWIYFSSAFAFFLILHSASFAALPSWQRPSPYFFSRKPPFRLVSLGFNKKALLENSFRIAARENRIADLLALIQQGVDINSQSAEGESALMYASRNCSIPAIQALIQAGANPDLQESSGKTALIFATEESCLSAVQLLLQVPGIQILKKDHLRKTALDYAETTASLEVDGPAEQILLLLQSNAPASSPSF